MTTNRSLVLGFIAISSLLMAAGCSAEVPADEAVQAEVTDETVDPTAFSFQDLTFRPADCANVTPESYKQATRLFQYGFGNDAAATFPSTTACGAVKSSLLALRSALNDTSVTVVNWSGPYTVCSYGKGPSIYKLTDKTTKGTILTPIINSLMANTTTCFGPGVIAYLVPSATTGAGATLWMDPEPATLTANLGSTMGASAAAYYNTSLDATTVKTWGGGYTSCGTFVTGGEMCSTTALLSGATATRMVQKNGTLCRCL
jgi:hypothetical protein